MTISDSASLLTAVVPALGALLGSAIGACMTYLASARTRANDRLKLISSWTKSEEVEKARITAYRELWRCLGGISTHRPGDIAGNLASVQERLQKWYYEDGGGLFLTGAAGDDGSTKSTFFAAREMESTVPAEIYSVFHALRSSIRRDLGIFESDSDEKAMQDTLAKKMAAWSKL